MPEPLKGKILVEIYEHCEGSRFEQVNSLEEAKKLMKEYENHPVDSVGDIFFEFEDVKQAVQGLIEEIDKLPAETLFGKVADIDGSVAIAPIEYIKKESVIALIKKWFADVINGGE